MKLGFGVMASQQDAQLKPLSTSSTDFSQPSPKSATKIKGAKAESAITVRKEGESSDLKLNTKSFEPTAEKTSIKSLKENAQKPSEHEPSKTSSAEPNFIETNEIDPSESKIDIKFAKPATNHLATVVDENEGATKPMEGEDVNSRKSEEMRSKQAEELEIKQAEQRARDIAHARAFKTSIPDAEDVIQLKLGMHDDEFISWKQAQVFKPHNYYFEMVPKVLERPLLDAFIGNRGFVYNRKHRMEADREKALKRAESERVYYVEHKKKIDAKIQECVEKSVEYKSEESEEE